MNLGIQLVLVAVIAALVTPLVRSDGGDLPLANQYVGTGIEAVGGVYDAPASEEQRIHAPGDYSLSSEVQASPS